MIEHQIPDIVKEKAKYLIEECGVTIEYLGKYQGGDAYCTVFPNDDETGFPSVFLLKNGEVACIEGYDALEIISLFIKD